MCFYDQYQFACGDFKFGHFRRRCNRVYPPGRSCGSRTAYDVFHLHKKCGLCDKIATHRLSQQQEWDRIDGFESKEQLDDTGVQRSIGIINKLQNEILTLELERRGRRITALDDDLESNGGSELGPRVERADLVVSSTPSIVPERSPSPPLDEPKAENQGRPPLSGASPSVASGRDGLQPAEWKAHRRCHVHDKRSKDIGDSVAKTSQGAFAESGTDMLEHWFKEHLTYPYPSEDEKTQLSSSTGLSVTQVRTIGLPRGQES